MAANLFGSATFLHMCTSAKKHAKSIWQTFEEFGVEPNIPGISLFLFNTLQDGKFNL